MRILILLSVLTLFACSIEDGEHKKFYKNGQLREIGNYINGKKEGEWKVYYENGQLSGIGKFVNDKIEGEWKEYDKNGQLKEITYWSNGEKLGFNEVN